MTRRVSKGGSEFDAYRETRRSVVRRFQPGTVLNVLQWVTPEVARFTVEGEGIEVWCCPQTVFKDRTEALEIRKTSRTW
jgi:hypothetical protein